MNQVPDFTSVLDDMADRARAEHMSDPVTLRHAADRRRHRRLAVAAACAAALVGVSLTVTSARQDHSAPPVSPHGFDCLAPAHGPRNADWSGEELNKPGWVETFPVVPPHHKVEFYSVAANETGFLVDGDTYAGNLGRTFHDLQAKLWFSTNGHAWTTLQRPTGVGGTLLAVDGTFYATGQAEDGSPVIWATTNGRDWESTTITHSPRRPHWPASQGVVLNRLTCVDGQLIAYGTDYAVMAGWSFTDGLHWVRRDPNGPLLHDLLPNDQPSLAGDGPTGTVAIPPWVEGWVPGRVWLHRS